MRPVRVRSDGAAIVYDADAIDKTDSTFFDPAVWRDRGALIGEARGRGAAWIIRHGGRELVLRHYRRGGAFGPWLGDRYLWLGLARSRAEREWRLLADLQARGLAVPRPIAARVRRRGLIYRADLITERIAAAESLAQRLSLAPLDVNEWRAVGQCIRRFHAAGVYHADLNAHNVLLAPSGVHLIDFDRGCLRAPGGWEAANLARLRRSLEKLARENQGFSFREEGWSELVAGYAGNPSAGQSSAKAAT
jgi:3-deoxy-D-manno-octulosonic acid kinase